MINEKILNTYQETNHFGRLIGMKLIEVEQGFVHYEMTIGKEHLATPKAAHGGVVAGMIDGTLGVAALSQVSHRNEIVATVEFKVNYLLPVYKGDQLNAKGRVVFAGNRLIYTECEVKNQKSELVAKASGTFNAYPFDKAF
ncbi:MAG: PaaI family thioesterase [Bacteroidota bacterium]